MSSQLLPAARATGAAAGRGNVAGLACLTGAALLWGTGGLVGTMLGRVTGLPALCVATVRLLAGGVLIAAYLAMSGWRSGRPGWSGWPAGRAAWRRVLVNGLLSALFQGSYFMAIALTSVSLATVVSIGATPVIVVIAERIGGHRARRGIDALTVPLGLAGLSLIAGFPSGHLGETSLLAGTALALVSAAGFAAVTMLGASPVPGLDDLTVIGYGFVIGGAMLLPVAALGESIAVRPGLGMTGSLAATGLLAALAVGPTGVAYTLYYRGLRTARPTTAALLTLLEPLAAAILGAIFLGDRIGAIGLLGGVLLLATLVCEVLAQPRRLN